MSSGAAEAGGLLYRGAEADIMRGRWQGLDAVYKVRRPLPYRIKVLDDAIRRQRTAREAEMIHAAKGAGVAVPHLYDVDVPEATLVMEYVQGDRLRDKMESYDPSEVAESFHDLGRHAASLHAEGMVHGDLTTANIIVRSEGIVFLDFGLSFRTSRLEDQAVDLRLIKETVTGAHPRQSARALDALFEGYSRVVGPAKLRAVQKQLRSIERRGRYARVT
jgi:TP53 regulating kinase and related kinases